MNAGDLVRLGLLVARNLGPTLARRAHDEFGGWVAAADAAAEGRPGFPEKLRPAFVAAPERGRGIRRSCRRLGIGVLFRGEPGWPDKLGCLGDAPEVLFHRGNLALASEPGVGIVGSRECTRAGEDLANRLASRLAEEGWCTVSGLARGIDAAAHRGAITAGGDTIAVLGCGIDFSYPEENRALQEEIAREGLLLSEFAPGAVPVPGNFPRRNRILAALSEAVVVVESRLRSGALITARQALDQGKDVYAVPGWPTSPCSAGPLELMRQGARPIRGADDLLEDLGGLGIGPPISADDRAALDAVESGATTASAVAEELGLEPREAGERLARLELLGLLSERERG